MFSRANTKPAASGPSTPPPATERKPERRASSGEAAADRVVPSIVSADLTVTGDLVSAGEIQIDGRVEGDIKCASLIIGISGAVTGEVSAQTVRMHGSVSGQVIAKSVFLASTARMIGDVTHESLAIEPGAFMEGHCRRMAEMPDLSLPDRKTGADGGEAPRLAGTAGPLANDAEGGVAGSASAGADRPDADDDADADAEGEADAGVAARAGKKTGS